MPKERKKTDGYREKAYEGDTKAMNNLGVCYERGTGVKVSLELAFEWYMKAAELGDVYGCFKVYQMDYPDYRFYDTLAAARRQFGHSCVPSSLCRYSSIHIIGSNLKAAP